MDADAVVESVAAGDKDIKDVGRNFSVLHKASNIVKAKMLEWQVKGSVTIELKIVMFKLTMTVNVDRLRKDEIAKQQALIMDSEGKPHTMR